MPRKRLLLFVFIILSLSLMTYQSNRVHLQPLKFLNFMVNSFHTMKVSVKDLVSSPFRRMLLREEENVKLKAEIAELRKERQHYREILLEHKRLLATLGLKEHEKRYVTSARVIARSRDQWANTLVLDKGRSEGIQKDMTAITENGFAGKIAEATDSFSYLLLVTDINFSAAVRLQENRTEGILSGTGFRKCRLKFIPHESTVQDGEAIITSGLDRLFPPGIPVGYISSINRKGSGIFQDIEVVPFVDDRKIEVVTIIAKE